MAASRSEGVGEAMAAWSLWVCAIWLGQGRSQRIDLRVTTQRRRWHSALHCTASISLLALRGIERAGVKAGDGAAWIPLALQASCKAHPASYSAMVTADKLKWARARISESTAICL